MIEIEDPLQLNYYQLYPYYNSQQYGILNLVTPSTGDKFEFSGISAVRFSWKTFNFYGQVAHDFEY